MSNIFKYLFNYLKPNLYVKSVKDINLQLLKKLNIKAIFCDLDNTLVPHFTKMPTKTAIDFANKVSNLDIKFIIVSNNSFKRVSEFCELLKVDDFVYNAKKPFVKKIKKIMNKYNLQPKDVIFIGDQFIFDIFVANRLNIKSILVLPKFNEEFSNKDIFINWIEQYLYKKLTHDNLNVDSNVEVWNSDDII